MRYKRYSGSFVGIDGVVWRADIMQEAEADFENVGELTFDADTPLEIEWEEKAKEEVICGSSATLRVISPADRTYTDLYSVEEGRVRLEVYKDGVAYWYGCLDTEQYEEPYESAAGYTVTLTFSDFGVFERLKLYGHENYTLWNVIRRALDAAGLEDVAINTELISTSINGGESVMLLTDVLVSGDNFYEDDGTALQTDEMIEGILQPLALRMIQRGGNVYVYDLNALYGAKNALKIEWDGDSQTLSTDKVYNNIKITWTPNVRNDNLCEEDAWDGGETPETKTHFYDGTLGMRTDSGKLAEYVTFHYTADTDQWTDDTDAGFTLWLSNSGKNVTISNTKAQFFKIVPQNDGEESEGVCVFATAVGGSKSGSSNSTISEFIGIKPDVLAADLTDPENAVIFKSSAVTLPVPVEAGDLYVRLTLPLMLDSRTNPFESGINYGKGWKEKYYYDQFRTYGNYLYIPVIIKCKAPDGTVYYWKEYSSIRSYGTESKRRLGLSDTTGEWSKYEAGKYSYLAYYDRSDLVNGTGVCGGKFADCLPYNRAKTFSFTTQLSKIDAGQYMPYPETGGDVWIEVLGAGWEVWDCSKDGDYYYLEKKENDNFFKYYDSGTYRIKHIFFKLPEIEILRREQFGTEIDDSDVIYSAELNAAAKEELTLDTICGSAAGGIAMARGAYMNATTNKQITEFTRAGVTTQAEELLIGTLYSQYAERHTKLTGDAKLTAAGVMPFTEANQSGKRFLLAGNIEDLRAACTEATLIELNGDEYVKTTVTTED